MLLVWRRQHPCERLCGLREAFRGWKQAGLLTVEDRSQPLPLMRQVQIAAGLLILCGVVLLQRLQRLSGLWAPGCCSPGDRFCGMARLLKVMPGTDVPDKEYLKD